jgi:hypothetical protein
MDFSDYLRRKTAAPVYVNYNSNAIASSNAGGAWDNAKKYIEGKSQFLRFYLFS